MMLNTIKKAAMDHMLASTPLTIVEATVISEPPDISIRLKREDGLELPNSLIIISEHLTDHKRYMTIRKSSDPKWNSRIDIRSNNVEEVMDHQGYESHVHDISRLELNNVQEDFTFEQVEVEYLDGLKEGDSVMVAIIQGGQTYFIFDRFKSYGEEDEE